MKTCFMAQQVALGVFELSYRRWLFFWYKIGEEVDGKFRPKRFGTLQEAIDYAAELGRESAAK